MPHTKWIRDCPEATESWNNYTSSVDTMELKDLVKEFFSYLDYTEVKGQEDREVRPIHISCGRVMMHEPLAYVILKLREKIDD